MIGPDRADFPRSVKELVAKLGDRADVVVGTAKDIVGVAALSDLCPGALMWAKKPLPALGALDCVVLVPEVSEVASRSITQVVVENPKLEFARLVHEIPQRNYPVTKGERVTVGEGTVIGAAGFGFVRDKEGHLVPFPQLGRVVIGNDVDIGCNTCIDRGALDDTVIGDGCKIDNLVHISHNVVLGADTMVIAGAVICGHVRTGNGVHIGHGSVIREGLHIGAGAIIGMGSVVVKDVPPRVLVYGNPARQQTSKWLD